MSTSSNTQAKLKRLVARLIRKGLVTKPESCPCGSGRTNYDLWPWGLPPTHLDHWQWVCQTCYPHVKAGVKATRKAAEPDPTPISWFNPITGRTIELPADMTLRQLLDGFGMRVEPAPLPAPATAPAPEAFAPKWKEDDWKKDLFAHAKVAVDLTQLLNSKDPNI